MAIFKKVRSANAGEYARRAWESGVPVYVYQIRAGFTHTNDLSRPIPDMGDQVAAIEAVGWYLDKADFAESNNKPTMYCVFRRREYVTIKPEIPQALAD